MSPLCWDVSPAGELWVTAGVPKLVVHMTTHTHTSTRAHGYPHVSARACYLDTCTCIYMCVQIYVHRPSRRIHTCCLRVSTHAHVIYMLLHAHTCYLPVSTHARTYVGPRFNTDGSAPLSVACFTQNVSGFHPHIRPECLSVPGPSPSPEAETHYSQLLAFLTTWGPNTPVFSFHFFAIEYAVSSSPGRSEAPRPGSPAACPVGTVPSPGQKGGPETRGGRRPQNTRQVDAGAG